MTEDSRIIYRGRIITLALEQVTLPNGVRSELEIVRHPGGAAVVAVDDEQRVCLLRQYRHACNDWLWELPAGKIDAGEAPLRTAQRELEEEAGRRADCWQPLGRMIASPGVFTEIVSCYLATGLTPCPTRHEREEVIEIHWLSFPEAEAMAMEGDIVDAKTVIGLCRARAQLQAGVTSG